MPLKGRSGYRTTLAALWACPHPHLLRHWSRSNDAANFFAALHARILRHLRNRALCTWLASQQRWRRPALAPARVEEVLSLRQPPAPHFASERAPPVWLSSEYVHSLWTRASRNATPACRFAPLRGMPSPCSADTKVVSTARCTPPNKSNLSAGNFEPPPVQMVHHAQIEVPNQIVVPDTSRLHGKCGPRRFQLQHSCHGTCGPVVASHTVAGDVNKRLR